MFLCERGDVKQSKRSTVNTETHIWRDHEYSMRQKDLRILKQIFRGGLYSNLAAPRKWAAKMGQGIFCPTFLKGTLELHQKGVSVLLSFSTQLFQVVKYATLVQEEKECIAISKKYIDSEVCSQTIRKKVFV